jgi:sugar lactone lactonase YvrE
MRKITVNLIIAALLCTPLFTTSIDIADSDEPNDWWDSHWNERIPLWVNETTGIAKGAFVVDQWFDFSSYNVSNATKEIRLIYHNKSSSKLEERPVQIMAERNSGSKCFEARVLFKTGYLAADQSHLYHIYFNNPSAAPSAMTVDFNGDLIKNRLLEPVPENNNYDFSGSADIDVDDNGNIYVIDRGNHRVQIFDSDGDFLNSLGTNHESGSDNISFSYPGCILVQGGYIFVSDNGNHRIQVYEEDLEYFITLGITGSPGTDMNRLDSPKDIAMDDSGKIYVADYGNHRIQVFDDLADGVADATIGITGVSGLNNSAFNYPYGVAVNGDWLYVSDSGNHRIQIHGLDGAYINTIGDTGRLGCTDELLFYPYGLDVGDDGRIYVADHKNQRVQVFTSTYDCAATIGTTRETGSAYSFLHNPTSVAVDGSDIYVADYDNNRVQVFTADNLPRYSWTLGSRTYKAISQTDFRDPRDVAVGPDGKIYVADYKNNRVQIFDKDYNYLDTIGVTGESGSSNTHLSLPYDVDVNATMIAIADAGNNRVQIFDITGAFITSITGEGDRALVFPCGVRLDDRTGKILIADTYIERLQVYNSDFTYNTTIYGADPDYKTTETGQPVGNITFKHPYDVEIGPDGMIYTIDTDHQCIQVFYPDNYTYSHTLEGGHWDDIEGIWTGDIRWACGFDLQGDRIYIADTYNHRIKVIGTDGSYKFVIGYNSTSGDSSYHFARPRGCAVGPDGKIFVSDADNNRIQIFDNNGTFVKSLSTSGLAVFDNKHFNNPESIVTDDQGTLYIADTNNHRVQVYDRFGVYKFTLGSSSKREAGSDNSHLFLPTDLDVGNGLIYVADKGNTRVQIFTLDGVYQRSFGIDCYDIKVGSNGYLYCAVAPNHCIRVYTADGSLVQTLGTLGSSGSDMEHLNFPTGVSIDTDGTVYVSDAMNHRIAVYDDLDDNIVDKVFGTAGESGNDVAHLSNPNSLAVSEDKLYVADTGNQRVQVFTKSLQYIDTIGITGKTGEDNTHFNGPVGLYLGNDGTILVADSDNNRVVRIADVSVESGALAAYSEPIEVMSPLQLIALIGAVTFIVLLGALMLKSMRPAQSHKSPLRDMHWGYSYLIKEEKPALAFQHFGKLSASEGASPLLVARTPPSQVESEFEVLPERMIWLSRVESEREYVQHMNSQPLPPILNKISSFLEENEKPVVLLEGIEHLITENSFDDVLKFIDSITPDIATKKGILIVPVDDRTMSVKEFSLLARGLHEIE